MLEIKSAVDGSKLKMLQFPYRGRGSAPTFETIHFIVDSSGAVPSREDLKTIRDEIDRVLAIEPKKPKPTVELRGKIELMLAGYDFDAVALNDALTKGGR